MKLLCHSMLWLVCLGWSGAVRRTERLQHAWTDWLQATR